MQKFQIHFIDVQLPLVLSLSSLSRFYKFMYLYLWHKHFYSFTKEILELQRLLGNRRSGIILFFSLLYIFFTKLSIMNSEKLWPIHQYSVELDDFLSFTPIYSHPIFIIWPHRILVGFPIFPIETDWFDPILRTLDNTPT